MGRTARLDTISGSKQLLLISLAYDEAAAPRSDGTSLIRDLEAAAPRSDGTSLIRDLEAAAPRSDGTSLIRDLEAAANDSHSQHRGLQMRIILTNRARAAANENHSQKANRERESFSGQHSLTSPC
jgi:hypothetical protein